MRYEVPEHGGVRRGSYLLTPERTQGNGRKRFKLTRNKRTFTLKASQLVALAFIGPSPFDGAEVCHNDGFIHNNHYSNLRWDSHAGNSLDVTKHRMKVRPFVGRSDALRMQANEILAGRAA